MTTATADAQDARIADLEAKLKTLFDYFEHIARYTSLPTPAEVTGARSGSTSLPPRP